MGRPRIDDRVAFTPIVFVLLTDVPWRMVPAAGVWERLHRELNGDANVLVAGGTPSVKKKESSASVPRRR